MLRYRIISGINDEKMLEDQVNKWIQDGWKPQGGVCLRYLFKNNDVPVFYQAMVKEEKK